MGNPAISVVVPAYNQEKYVEKCILSVLSQSFRDFELIVVNDGSTDKSLEICQKYVQRDDRVSVIDKPNGGSAYARRDGMLQAKGQYICYIDSDDYIDPYALEKLYTIVSQYQVDAVIGNFDKVLDDRGLLRKRNGISPLADREIDREELFDFFIGGSSQLATLPWGRLYKLDCLKKAIEADEDLLFPPGKIPGEDRCMNLALAPFLNSMWITNDILYHYRFGGMTSKYWPLVKRGGFYFDSKYDMCNKYHLENCLPNVFSFYMDDLYFDVRLQMHFGVSDEAEMRQFIEQELSTRKIVLWAKDNLPKEIRSQKDADALLQHDIDGVLFNAMQKEKALWKHYMLVRLLKLYQRIPFI